MIEKTMVSIALGLAGDHIDLLESLVELLATREKEFSKEELEALVENVKSTDASFKQVLTAAQEQLTHL
jgi:Na+/phosphate symporter